MTKIVSKKQIPWGEVIVVRELNATQQTVEQLEKSFAEANPEYTLDQIQYQVYQQVCRDNYYSRMMDLVASCYKFEIDEKQVSEQAMAMIVHNPDLTLKQAKEYAEVNIKRDLIYNDVAQVLRIIVNDDYVKQMLDQWYQSTGNPIREYLEDPVKFNNYRKELTHYIVTQRLMNAFKPDYQLDEFHERMRQMNEQNRQVDSQQKSASDSSENQQESVKKNNKKVTKKKQLN